MYQDLDQLEKNTTRRDTERVCVWGGEEKVKKERGKTGKRGRWGWGRDEKDRERERERESYRERERERERESRVSQQNLI